MSTITRCNECNLSSPLGKPLYHLAGCPNATLRGWAKAWDVIGDVLAYGLVGGALTLLIALMFLLAKIVWQAAW